MTPRVVALSAVLAAATAAARAEEPATRASIVAEIIDGARLAAQTPLVQAPFSSRIDAGNTGLVASYLISLSAEREGYQALLDAMDARTNKQIGSAPRSSGSTSVAVKGLAPEILGLAVEHGAITREVDGTSVTFRGTPTGLVKALQGNGLLDIYRDYGKSRALRTLARLSGAVSFDTSRGGSRGAVQANGDQFTGWSVRYEAYNARDPGSPRYAARWGALARNSAAYRSAATTLNAPLAGWQGFKAWQDQLVEAARKIDEGWKREHDLKKALGEFQELLDESFPRLADLPEPPLAVRAALDGYVQELTGVQNAVHDIYAFAERGLLATFEWTGAREPSLPDLFTFTGVLEGGVGAHRRDDLTLNVGVSFYRSAPVSVPRRFKSFEVAAEYAHLLGKARALPFTLSLAGRYNYLPDDVAEAGGVAPKGHIAVGQVKLTFPLAKGSGVKVPLALTVSNRTELIKEREVRANFGFTFDLDGALSAVFAR